jgi:hypothetical protein
MDETTAARALAEYLSTQGYFPLVTSTITKWLHRDTGRRLYRWEIMAEAVKIIPEGIHHLPRESFWLALRRAAS